MLPRRAPRTRRVWTVAAAALLLAVLLGTLAVVIGRAQQESRSQLLSNFKLRGTASANLVSTYISQQAARERVAAARLLTVPRVTASRFATLAIAFGAQGAALLDSRSRVLNVTPGSAGRRGESFAAYPTAAPAAEGKVAVSNVLPAPRGLGSIVTIAVPFRSAQGRRVFAAAYGVGRPDLEAFVDRAIAYSQHEVLLIDQQGELLAASPRTSAGSIWGANLALAEAVSRRSTGSVRGAKTPSTFTVASVPGTPWRMVLMVPNSRLYATIQGITAVIPWIVFALVSVLGLGLLALFARSLADRARLAALSEELEGIARTDSLTGLANRRGIEEDLAREFARVRRRDEPMTVLMIDLDRFKEVNDRHGHDAGDRVLVAVAACMREALRSEDVYGRLGGDEFVVVMAGADEQHGRRAADRLQERAAAVDVCDLGLPRGVPISIGIACGVHVPPADLMRRADADLYRVKAARRAQAQAAAGAPDHAPSANGAGAAGPATPAAADLAGQGEAPGGARSPAGTGASHGDAT